MKRRIIRIDEERCNGCGACARACHEGAIAMAEGKARLLRDDYCDGLGDCLPACPTGAISFEEREAAPYDAGAVAARMGAASGGCPGSASRTLAREEAREDPAPAGERPSRLSQWPVQLQLAPLEAPYFDGAELLIAADCAAYARGDFHESFIRGRVTLIGCPKLDHADYAGKLAEIFRRNRIRGVTVARMEVPCCGGLERAVGAALESCGKEIPCRVATLSVKGELL